MTLTSSQATVIQADAADDKAISDACQQALKEEGRLDVFFANVRIRLSTLLWPLTGFCNSGWHRNQS